MNEYQRLMQRYGVGSATRGNMLSAAPTDPAAADYADLMADYTADKSEYDRYARGWDQRLGSVGQYGEGWKGDILQGPQYRPRRTRPVPKSVADAVIGAPAEGFGSGLGKGSESGSGAPGSNIMAPVSQSSGVPGSGVNDIFYKAQEALNTPVGAGASWLAGKLGLLGGLTQDPTNVPVVDVMGQSAADIQTRNELAEHQRQVAAEQEAQRLAQERADAAEAARIAQEQAAAQAAAQEAARVAAAQEAARVAAQTTPSGGLGSMGGGWSPDYNSAAKNAEMAAALNAAGYYSPPDTGSGSYSPPDTGSFGGSGTAGSNGPGDGTASDYARGGIVKKYASGGLNELNAKYAPPGMTGSADIPGNEGLDLSRVSPGQLEMLMQQDPEAVRRGAERFGSQVTQAQPAAAQPPTLETMLAQYADAPSEYAAEYKASRERSTAAQERFNKLLEAQMSRQGETGPSKAEMYFNLAAAFGAPTKTGHFTESLGSAAQVMGAHQKETRSAKQAAAAEAAKLGLTVAQANALAAREEEAGLRVLTAEEMRTKRAQGLEALKEKYRALEPKSEAGKTAADLGLKRGTPEYTSAVDKYTTDKFARDNLYREAMTANATEGLKLRQAQEARAAKSAEALTPNELKMKVDLDERVTTSDQALKELKRAYDLSTKAFGASLGDVAQRKLLEETQPKHQRVVDTRELENLLQSGIISGSAEKMKGVLSDSDMKLLTAVQGMGAKSPEERDRILLNAYGAMKRGNAALKKRLADVSSRKYREATPEAPTTEE